MDIAIDFDGTCVTHEYPKVGRDIGAQKVLKRLVENGHNLILYTMRSNNKGISPVTNKVEEGGLQDAIDWFKKNNIPLYGIQTNPTQSEWTSSPKCYAQLYIDDSALGAPLKYYNAKRPYIDWKIVEAELESKRILKDEFLELEEFK